MRARGIKREGLRTSLWLSRSGSPLGILRLFVKVFVGGQDLTCTLNPTVTH